MTVVAPSWLAKYPAYAAFLRAIEPMTPDDLAAKVALLSDGERAGLAVGPLRYRYDCQVCVALGSEYLALETYELPLDLDDPRAVVWAYHEVPKLHMHHRDESFYGPLANDAYVRCLDTYRAAGWTGDAPEPNA